MDYGTCIRGHPLLPEADRLQHQANLRPARFPQPFILWQIRKGSFRPDARIFPSALRFPVLLSVRNDWFPSFFPSNDAAFEIHTFIPRVSQSASSISGTTATPAINSDGLFGWECCLGFLHEIALSLVNENGPGDMTFRELSSRPYVENDNTGVCHKCCKTLNIGVFEILLTASRCQP